MNHEDIEIAHTTDQVIDVLNIGSSTLRKWCISLEENGHKFTRVEQNKRLFYQNDIEMLKHFQKLVQEHKLQLEQASKLVVPMFQKVDEEEVLSTRTTSVPVENEVLPQGTTSVPVEFLAYMEEQKEQQQQFQKEVFDRFDKQNDEIQQLKSLVNQYESKAVETLRTALEQQKETATAEETKKNESWFKRLFKR